MEEMLSSNMQKQRSLKKNFLMNCILTMSSFVFPLITFPYVTRILQPIGMGKVSFATSLISYFSLFAQLGIPTYGIRVCAQVRDDKEKLSKIVHELIFINLVMCLAAYFVLGFLLWNVKRFQTDKLLYIIISLQLILNAIGVEWLYKALEQYTYITIRSIIFKIIALFALYVFVHNSEDYIAYGAITILASSASNILNFINIRKYVSLKWIGKYNLKYHYKPIMIFFAMSCATVIYTHIDTLMLGFMKDDFVVGCYDASIKIKSVLVSIVTSLGTVILPRASYYVEQKRLEDFKSITRKSLTFVWIVATPLATYFIMEAKQIILFLSGDSYISSIVPMQIIMPTILFIGLSNILGLQVLVPLGKEKIVLLSEVAGAVVDLVMNILFIPRHGAAGAAFGTLVAEFVVLLVQFIALRRRLSSIFKELPLKKVLIAISISGLMTYMFKMVNMPYFLAIVVSALICFGCYFLILLIEREDFITNILKLIIGRLINGKQKQRY